MEERPHYCGRMSHSRIQVTVFGKEVRHCVSDLLCLPSIALEMGKKESELACEHPEMNMTSSSFLRPNVETQRQN